MVKISYVCWIFLNIAYAYGYDIAYGLVVSPEMRLLDVRKINSDFLLKIIVLHYFS